jgi:hypothetical protein
VQSLSRPDGNMTRRCYRSLRKTKASSWRIKNCALRIQSVSSEKAGGLPRIDANA